MKLPIKTRVLEYAIEKGGGFTPSEIAQVMAREYPKEKTAAVKYIEKIIQTYCGVGIMRAEEFRIGEDGNLHITYVVTDFGKASLS